MAEKSINPLDPYSPYYPNREFDPGHFSIEKLCDVEDNYVFWKLRFLDFLRFTNKIGFVDGTIKKPEPSSPLFQPWEQCNAIVMCWLMSSVTEKVLSSILYAETAHKAWENLRQRFVPSVDLKIYELRRKIAATRQGGDSVTTYIGKLSKAWLELSEYDPVPECSCGGCKCETTKRANEAREKEQRYAFLMGLNRDLDYVRMELMYKKSPPSLDEAYGRVTQAETMMNWNKSRR